MGLILRKMNGENIEGLDGGDKTENKSLTKNWVSRDQYVIPKAHLI